MFHRRYSASPAPKPAPLPDQAPVREPGFTHEVKLPGPVMEAHREKLRQRHEDALLQEQLLETEQELHGIKEEEKELARRREELQMLNDRQTAFHDRRLALEDRIQQALLDFDRESRSCERDAKALELALEACRRYLGELEQMAPAAIPPLRSEVALRRQLEFLEDFEGRLDAELRSLEDRQPANRGREGRLEMGFADSFRRGFRFFLPYLGAGAVGLLLFLSLTGGGR